MMHGVGKHAEDRHTGLHWLAVSGVQPIAYVARLDDRPLAILEYVPGTGFRMTTCAGESLGHYVSAEEAADALMLWVREREAVRRELSELVAV